jgi:D-glycero-beta-D-manno-heptose-7-phosphate kinase
VNDFDGILSRFANRRVLVLGDMVADEYLIGRPTRISREAPVLILALNESFVRPGGATNTAYNLCTLGARTSVVGVVGDDEPGRRLTSALRERGMDTTSLLVDPHRPTSTATRVVAKGTQEVQQQVVRVDRIETGPMDVKIRDRMISLAVAALDSAEALVFSDYEHGVISQEVIDACLPKARQRGIVITVDSHGDLARFKGVTAATPNQPEAAASVLTTIETEDDLNRAGRQLLADMEATGILITRGSQGIALYERDREPYHLPVALSDGAQVIDATGAGDTVSAVFTLALTCGSGMREAAYLANVAGGAVVRLLGAATLSLEELRAAVASAAPFSP